MFGWLRKRSRRDTPSVQDLDCAISFTNMNGYSKIAAMLTPDQLGAYMRRFLNGQAEAIMASGGEIGLLIGDTIEAFWSLPTAAEECCKSMLAQHVALVEFNCWTEANALPAASMRIGAHYGRCMLNREMANGQIRLLGDSVNLASRIEALNKEYGTRFLISGAIESQLGDAWKCRSIDRVMVKGKSGAMTLSEFLGPKTEMSISLEFLNEYEAAMGLYLSAHIPAALEAFENAAAMLPNDRPTALYVGRCRELLANPPQVGWDGVWTYRYP